MSDTLNENILKHINDEETQFLGRENREKLNKIFGNHRVGGKLKIGVGVHELVLKQKVKKKTRNDGEMIVLSFYKPPVRFDGLKNKVSYQVINCYHILQKKGWCKFKDNWFKPFTACLDESQFDVIDKGDEFLCLVGHEERLFEKDGEVMTYEKGGRVGSDIVLIEPRILKIYNPDIELDSIKIEYLKLYKELK